MRALALTALLALTACATKPEVRTVTVHTPGEVVRVPVPTFVPIPDSLTAPCPIAEGKISEVLEVARKRKAALEACNGQLEAIRRVQGKARE